MTRNMRLSIFVDLRKAVDTVNHEFLLCKLECYGVRVVSLKCFRSYLTNRQQFVCVNEANTSMLPITMGVPQGNVLGHVLFLIYVNGFPNISDNIKFSLFADDTTVTIKDNNFTSLIANANNIMEKINVWAVANRLTIKIYKTKCMVFSFRDYDTTDSP